MMTFAAANKVIHSVCGGGAPRRDRRLRGGVFDMLHVGHLRLRRRLEKHRELGCIRVTVRRDRCPGRLLPYAAGMPSRLLRANLRELPVVA